MANIWLLVLMKIKSGSTPCLTARNWANRSERAPLSSLIWIGPKTLNTFEQMMVQPNCSTTQSQVNKFHLVQLNSGMSHGTHTLVSTDGLFKAFGRELITLTSIMLTDLTSPSSTRINSLPLRTTLARWTSTSTLQVLKSLKPWRVMVTAPTWPRFASHTRTTTSSRLVEMTQLSCSGRSVFLTEGNP